MIRLAAAALSLALTATALLIAAQQAPAVAPRQPTFRSEANYIRVDAFIATRDGVAIEDLTLADFELLEDGVLQKIEAFEHVRIQPAGPQVARIEPNSQQTGHQMAAEPRARVFVLFLDVDHVPVEGSYRLKTALAAMLTRMLGVDDFIGILTSRHSPTDLILARKTALIEEQLEKYWYWGQMHGLSLHRDETSYLACYGRYPGGETVAYEMIARRREKLALDALRDLVVYLRGVREERKAVLILTAGWPLFRPDLRLARPLGSRGGGVMAPPPIIVGPGGQPRSGDDPREPSQQTRCDQHRLELAQIDHWDAFQRLMQDANRANVSFYPIDPRGLVVFDTPISAPAIPSLTMDAAMVRARQTSLRTLAEETDGLAVVSTNNLVEGLRKISADLTSYYLLGYYSPNASLDGKYHRITVRVKRPGAVVRARKGYRAASRDEVARGAEVSAAPPAAARAGNAAAASALNRLSLIRPDAAMYVHATHERGGALWVAGEIPAATARTDAWARGVRVSIMAVDASGSTVGVARKEIAPGQRDFVTPVALDDPAVTPARVQVRAEPAGAPAVGLEVAPLAGAPLLMRRSGAATPKAAADFRFFRTEELIYRWPLAASESSGRVRVLDRAGEAMALSSSPVEQSADGGRWMTGTLTLAPLVNGDYLLELTKQAAGATKTVLVPFRIAR